MAVGTRGSVHGVVKSGDGALCTRGCGAALDASRIVPLDFLVIQAVIGIRPQRRMDIRWMHSKVLGEGVGCGTNFGAEEPGWEAEWQVEVLSGA